MISAETTLRDEVLTYYGRACMCPGCGETQLSCLQLDHKAAGGNAQRRDLKRQGSSFYRDVSAKIEAGDHAWLRTLQILCQRCNQSKRDGTHCTLDHNNLQKQDDSTDVLAETSTRPIDRNEVLADDELTQVNGRVKPATRKYLTSQGLSIGKVLDGLVEEKVSGEFTVLREVRQQSQEIKALILAQHTSTPPTTSQPVAAVANFPWMDPGQSDAWNAFKAQWDAEHHMPPSTRTTDAPSAVVSPRPSVGICRRVLRWLWTH